MDLLDQNGEADEVIKASKLFIARQARIIFSIILNDRA